MSKLEINKTAMKFKNNEEIKNQQIVQSDSDSITENTKTFKISDELQISVQGFPAMLSQREKNTILTSLVHNTLKSLPDRSYQEGENIYQGHAKLKIENKIHEITYSLDAIRVLTALTIYKEAFDLIKKRAMHGVYDQELSDLTGNYLKQEAWQEIKQSSQKHKRPEFKHDKQAKKNGDESKFVSKQAQEINEDYFKISDEPIRLLHEEKNE